MVMTGFLQQCSVSTKAGRGREEPYLEVCCRPMSIGAVWLVLCGSV